MSDPDRDLHDPDLLAALSDAPLPPLATAAQVRARGDQRRARSRALLAGAGAAVVLLGAGATYALGTGPDTLRTAAPAPSRAPAAATSPATPTPTPAPTQTPTATATATAPPPPAPPTPASPSASATASASSSPSPVRDVAVPAAALVDAADLGAYWVRTASSRSAAEPALDPCGEGLPGASDVVAHVSGDYGMRDADGPVPESAGFSQQVVRYPSAERAAEAAAQVRASVGRCPVQQLPSGTLTLRVVGSAPYLVESSYTPGDSPQPLPFLDYSGVTVAGDLLSTWSLADPHGVPRADADRVAALVQAALCRAGDGAC